MIEVANLSAELGGRRVLGGIDLRLHPGRVSAIVGPNGSGKTTLLRALCHEIAHGGEVRLNGCTLAALGPAELADMRAVLPQAGSVAFPFTVLELVRLGLSGHAGRAAQDLPLRALDRVGLSGFAGRMVQDLSGGERQRVQLARVLVQIWEPVGPRGPRWLFLDEPVSALDIRHQLQVMEVARAYARAGGGVVAVMHDLNLTSMFADHVVLLNGGRISGQGAPGQVLTDGALSACYGCPLRVNTVPPTDRPWILPQAVGHDG